jgi:uncharacterized membrane protein
VLLELTFLRVAWTFNVDVAHYLLAGVIWAIGWCMVLMAALVFLPERAVLAVGVAICAGHDLLDRSLPALRQAAEASPLSALWQVLYLGGPVPLGSGGPVLFVLYSIVPWIGVMAVGYGFGEVLALPRQERRRLCLAIGGAATAAFLLLRFADVYGDPRPWHAGGRAPAALRFLNATKYPASLDFLLMTLGPAIALLPLLEDARSRAARVLALFGRVPLFYYVLHIPLIHAVACGVSLIREGRVDPWLFANHPVFNPPAPSGYTWSLPLLYLVTALVVAALYPACALRDRRRFRAT